MTDFISQYNSTPFQRTAHSISPLVSGSSSGSFSTFGDAFILLNARVIGANSYSPPIRLRLYSDESSIATDASRPAGDYNIDPSVALIGDIVFSSGVQINMDPPIIGITYESALTHYHVESSATTTHTIALTAYPIANDGTAREEFVIMESSVPNTGNGVSGSITTAPKSFIIISGSVNVQSRLRLYSRPASEVSSTEQTRGFDTASSSDKLIADMMFDVGGTQYPLVPALEAYTRLGSAYSVGTGEVGYILQNLSGGASDMTASLYIYSTED